MNLLSTHYIAGRLTLKTASVWPDQLQQLAYQLTMKSQLILNDSGYFAILLMGFVTVIILLFGCLWLLLNSPIKKTVQPFLRATSPKQTYHPTRVADTHIAKANRDELQLGSARIRAGQCCN